MRKYRYQYLINYWYTDGTGQKTTGIQLIIEESQESAIQEMWQQILLPKAIVEHGQIAVEVNRQVIITIKKQNKIEEIEGNWEGPVRTMIAQAQTYLPNILIGSPLDCLILEAEGFVLRKTAENLYDILITPKETQVITLQNPIDGHGFAYLTRKYIEIHLIFATGLNPAEMILQIPSRKNCSFAGAIQVDDHKWWHDYLMARNYTHSTLSFGENDYLDHEYEWSKHRVFE